MRKLTQLEIDQRKQNAIEWLRERLPHGTTICTVLVHRARDRITGVVSVLVILDGEIKNISSTVSDALVAKWDDRDGIWTNSAFDLVMRLSYALHGDKSKGRISPKALHPKATPSRFRAGYTFEHKAL